MKKLLFVTGALLLAAPVTSALAHDDDYYFPYFQHQLDHAEHERFHQEFDGAHEYAHEQGFQSPEEHRAWHQAYEATHDQFHEDHPGTWHDHAYGYGRPYGYYNYYGYRPSYGYSFWFGR